MKLSSLERAGGVAKQFKATPLSLNNLSSRTGLSPQLLAEIDPITTESNSVLSK